MDEVISIASLPTYVNLVGFRVKYRQMLILLSLALMISTGLISAPLSKNGTLVRNGTVVSDVYFFGQSPPVYPSPLGNGTGDWAESYASAAALVAQLTMNEKVS